MPLGDIAASGAKRRLHFASFLHSSFPAQCFLQAAIVLVVGLDLVDLREYLGFGGLKQVFAGGIAAAAILEEGDEKLLRLQRLFISLLDGCLREGVHIVHTVGGLDAGGVHVLGDVL